MFYYKIMGLFNFFGDHEHKVFDHKPIYYDKDVEERKKLFGAVDGSNEREDKTVHAPGSYIKGAFRDGAYQKTKSHTTKVQTIIGIVTMILIFAVLYMIAKFYASL